MSLDSKTIKICVSSVDNTLNSDIDSRFGRCKYFMLVNVVSGKSPVIEFFKNKGAVQGSGAGISAAEQVGELGANVLITGNIGPKAGEILNQLEVEVIEASGVAKEVVDNYIENKKIEVEKDIHEPHETVEIDKNSNQRIFIPLMDNNGENSEISLHFGHAPFFGLYNLSSKKLTITENNLNHSNSNESPVDQIIRSVDPTVVFAQDMGVRAIDLFTEKNIELRTGQYKIVKEVIDNIDKLKKLTKGCGH